MMADMDAFLKVLREGHPDVEIVVCSPVIRPDAEETRNRLGATLDDLREAVEDVTLSRIDRGDAHLTLVRGAALLRPEHLTDGIHPSDEGHRILAEAFGRRVAEKAGVAEAMSTATSTSTTPSGPANARQ
jgi:lysophospholipase L1-like esterase